MVEAAAHLGGSRRPTGVSAPLSVVVSDPAALPVRQPSQFTLVSITGHSLRHFRR